MLGRKVISAVLLVLTFVGLVTSAPSVSATPCHWPQTISARSASLYPEGVAWDPSRQAFLVSSIGQGTVSVVWPDGTVRPLIAHPRMVSTFGVHVDAPRGRVLVTYADMGMAQRSTPATTFSSSGVGIFDLATGRLLHLVELDIGPGKHAANDLAIDADGAAYVTDPASNTIYRVTPDGRGSALVTDARLASPSIGMNGIVWNPRGFLLTVRYDTGTLLRIPVHHPHQIDEVALTHPLVGGDGLALRPDGASPCCDPTPTGRQRGWRSRPHHGRSPGRPRSRSARTAPTSSAAESMCSWPAATPTSSTCAGSRAPWSLDVVAIRRAADLTQLLLLPRRRSINHHRAGRAKPIAESPWLPAQSPMVAKRTTA
jgi:sugar lactone lactonase YvrE